MEEKRGKYFFVAQVYCRFQLPVPAVRGEPAEPPGSLPAPQPWTQPAAV